MQKHDLVLKLLRSIVMVGCPSHCPHAQVQATGGMFDISPFTCMFNDVLLVSFDDTVLEMAHLQADHASVFPSRKLQEANKMS